MNWNKSLVTRLVLSSQAILLAVVGISILVFVDDVVEVTQQNLGAKAAALTAAAEATRNRTSRLHEQGVFKSEELVQEQVARRRVRLACLREWVRDDGVTCEAELGAGPPPAFSGD